MSEDLFTVQEQTESFPNYVGQVVDAKFTVNPDYDPEALILDWTILPAPGQKIKKEHHIGFSCGKSFKTYDGGATAEHKSGKPMPFGERSRVGMVVKRMFYEPSWEAEPPVINGVEMETGWGLRGHFVDNNYSPLDAAGYVGLVFEFGDEQIDYGKKIGKKVARLPQRFLGYENVLPDDWEGEREGDDEDGGEADEAPAPKRRRKAPTLAQLKAKATEVAADHTYVTDDEYSEMIEAVGSWLKDQGIDDDHEIWEYVENDGPDGLWAQLEDDE